ncbi:helix-turn-helix transcriptional regulator [Halarcobacter sp.]|uniref:helix-turn-helix transcriptional regulator n=1 Tax=Halarcobacter sp. TaxID=2321133 RepID=UPI002AAC1CE0|nr:helix-turn-helix transcriptional regulator [Halarcobacter sp.]
MQERLEKVRKNAGLTKKDFAKKIEITEQAYQNYSKGIRPIPTDIALKIKHSFNISLDWLLDGEQIEYIDYKKEIIKSLENLSENDIKSTYHFIKSKEN